MAKVIIIGPAHPLRGGGMTTFNHRLAKEFLAQGHECCIYSFSLQYPSFLFPGKSQYTDEPAPGGITIHTKINSIHPFNWIKVGNEIKKQKPDIVVVRYWLPFMGPCLGTILRRIKTNGHTKIICIADNIIPHEKRPGDKPFTKYFVKPCDVFITMSEKVLQDLRTFTSKPARLVPHPLYDNFGDITPKDAARKHLSLPDGRIILFFGFIRKYKGLDLLLEAMSIIKEQETRNKNQEPNNRYPASRNQYPETSIPHPASSIPHPASGIQLLIAGEFYEDEKPYLNLISQSGISDRVILKTSFIPDNEVKYYLCAADAVVQPYRNATQSGVTPLAYHFEKPMIVTNVGGLPALVPHERSGLITEPDPGSIANAINRFYELGEAYFIPGLREEKIKYSWSNFVNAIITSNAGA